jgi:thiol-disulfide isomerase/thioredoxin
LLSLFSSLLFVIGRPQDALFTSDNFVSNVVQSGNVHVIEYFSKMCGSCKEFEPTWDQVANSIENEYRIGRVNIDTKEGMRLAKEQGILKRGIPAIQVVAGKDSSIVMAGKLLGFSDILQSISTINQGFNSKKHPGTGLFMRPGFDTMNEEL